MKPTFFGTVAGGSSEPRPIFDTLSTTNSGVWDLRKQRTAYEGYAVRAALAADSGATTLDIGFNEDGSFDMDAYEAFGTGSERIVTWYDQSGNGFDLTRAWSATLCPIIRTSSYNSKPCIYFTGAGSLGIAGFTDWNGLAAANFYFARKFYSNANGFMMAGGSPARYIYGAGGFATREMRWDTSSSVESQFYQTCRWAGSFDRFYFNGGGATTAEKVRYYENEVNLTRDTGSGTPGTTLANETGIYFNGDSGGGNPQQAEYWAIYYIGYLMTDEQAALVNTAVNFWNFTLTNSQIFCTGDSLTLNSANGGPSDPDAYPNLLVDALETFTGTTWDLFSVALAAEAGAQTDRVLQIDQSGGNVTDNIDVHYPNHIVVAWAGTNDLAAGDSASTALTGSASIASASYDIGATVYYLNMLPRKDLGGGNAAFEASRVTYNAGLAAALGATATVVDVATLLPDCEDLTYYLPDTLHLNDAGNAVVANAVAAAIEADL